MDAQFKLNPQFNRDYNVYVTVHTVFLSVSLNLAMLNCIYGSSGFNSCPDSNLLNRKGACNHQASRQAHPPAPPPPPLQIGASSSLG